jgi:hypothetical protein
LKEVGDDIIEECRIEVEIASPRINDSSICRTTGHIDATNSHTQNIHLPVSVSYHIQKESGICY